MERHEWQLPEGFTQEQIDQYAAEQERKRRREYNKAHPDVVINQRKRAYINFLRKQGVFVMDAGSFPPQPWDILTEKAVLRAIKANLEGLRHE